MRRKISIRQPFYGFGWPAHFPAKSEPLIETSDYRGQAYLKLACTQLAPPFTASDQRRIVEEWCTFFATASKVRELGLFSRTPRELFEAICGRAAIQRLHIKWGPVVDLSPIRQLTNLDGLWLGTSGVTDLSPLADLPKLTHLALDNLKKVRDFSALARAKRLQYLYIEGYPQGPQKIRIKDLAFLRKLKDLRALYLGFAIIENFDVDALLELRKLEYLELPQSGRTAVTHLDEHSPMLRKQLKKLRYGNVVTHESSE